MPGQSIPQPGEASGHRRLPQRDTIDITLSDDESVLMEQANPMGDEDRISFGVSDIPMVVKYLEELFFEATGKKCRSTIAQDC